MKSKKILGLLLACSLGFSVLPGKAFAKGVQAGGENTKAIHYVRADYNTIIKTLIEEGVINKNTTKEEALEIAKKLFSNSHGATDKLSPKEKAQREKITSKMKELGIKSEKDVLKSFQKGKDLVVPQTVQAEEFGKEAYVAKPLVILMDFQDYKFGDMADENIEYKFDNYDTDYFQRMLFNDETFKGPNGEDFITMKQYYLQQSGGSYTVDGNVTGWYTAEHDAKYYGEQIGDDHDRDARSFIREALVEAAADPTVDLSQYDIEDRYDVDGDGDYNEPDGVIDHIIVVHAGVGQEQGGGSLGDDAMWSHRWVLDFYNDFEFVDHNGDTWKANDYTLQPQSGAVGVFAHEYGHDLGLPDEYDTSGNSYSGSPVGSWSIMSGGSWSGEIGGTMPTGFSAWAKEFLQASMPDKNWLKGATIDFNNIPEEGYTLLLDEAATKGVNNDVVRIDLPAYTEKMINVIEGDKLLHSTKGNNIDTSMEINIDLTGKTEAKLQFKTAFEIEELWDWASVSVRVNGTDEWTVIPGNITTTESYDGAIITVENGITGSSEGWTDAEFDLTAYAGQNIDIMFRYQTDPGYELSGWFVDDLKVVSGEETVYSENFEGTPAAEFNGFVVNNGTESFEHYYLAEWRNHSNADKGLEFAEGEIAYEPGLVIWYVNNDKFNEKNHVGDHPGEGFLSVVDADQQIDPYIVNGNSYLYGPSAYRIHDAAFGLDETRPNDNVYLFTTGSGLTIGYNDMETFMNPYFSDGKDYSNGPGRLAEAGVILKNYGLKIYVTGQSKDKSVGRIHIMRDNK